MTRLQTFVDEVALVLSDPTVTMYAEEKQDGRNQGRRKVRWYHPGGGVEMTSQAGGRLSAGDTKRSPAVWQRLSDIEAHITAESADTLELLLDNLIVACDQSRPNGSVKIDRYDWTYNEAGQRVPEAILYMRLTLPVADEQRVLTTINHEEKTYELEI